LREEEVFRQVYKLKPTHLTKKAFLFFLSF